MGMKKRTSKVLLLAGTTALAPLAFASAQEQRLPDLVINVEDSYVNPGSCDKASPIASGRIAIKNIGNWRAGTGDTDADRQDKILQVYNPYSPDITVDYNQEQIEFNPTTFEISRRTGVPGLAPLDQRGMEFFVGVDKVKAGRMFTAPTGKS
ncbi:MAG: hypothetical protein AAFR16_10075, partial [Pseudomonadota bacterium]